jgi:LytS/YehU family sensor histidine kinase
VENSKLPAASLEEKSGIGLQNVKRRLELSYPEKHNLQIEDLADKFSVKLTLSLN